MPAIRSCPTNSEKTARTVCHSHCGGACPLRVHVRDGSIARIETDDSEYPQVRGCLRGRAYRQRVYAAGRVLYPLRRTGPRGSGQFKRVSWDEALDHVASEIRRVRDTYGPSAIGYIQSGGDIVQMHTAALIYGLLARAGGCSPTWGQHSGEGGHFAQMVTYGTMAPGNTRDDFLNSRLIIMWGWDPASTISFGNTNLYLALAREAGIPIISVDPRYTDSAVAVASRWIPIRPGTDAAMLVAMAYVVIKDGLYDQSYVDRHVAGFDLYRDYVLGIEDGIGKTPAWAEAITGVPAATIAGLARDFARSRPAALMDGIAPGRTAYGEQFHRAAIALAAMTGNIGIRGGNAPGYAVMGGTLAPVSFGAVVGARLKWVNPVEVAAGPRLLDKFNSLGTSRARVNRFLLADAILKGRAGGYPADLKMLYMVTLNYLNQCSNTNKIIEALRKLEFTVIHEQFMTPTAKFADIVLPANTYMERNDLSSGGIAPFLGYMNKAVEPVGESKSHFEIAVELASRLGISDYTDKNEEAWLAEIVRGRKDIGDLAVFKEEGVRRFKFEKPYVCFEKQIADPANNRFPTPSGKIEVHSKVLADAAVRDLPAIPKYIETWESLNDRLASKFPLQLVTTHTRRRAHTQFENLPWLRELYPQCMTMNPRDAKKRGIKQGDRARVFNDRGRMVIPVMLTERIMPGVVEIPQGSWYSPDGSGVDLGGCTNVLSRDAISPGGAFPSNTCLVQVEKA